MDITEIITYIINKWSDAIDAPSNAPVYCGNPSKEIWTMRDGTQIHIGDMSDSHLNNCWQMVAHKNTLFGQSTFWERVFEAETEKRRKRRYRRP